MNEFANIDIHLPEEYREYFHAYSLTRTEGTRNNPEDSPFPRMVDMWFLAVCIAVKEGPSRRISTAKARRTRPSKDLYSPATTWRSNALMLLAIAHTGDVAVASDPHEMMRVAKRLRGPLACRDSSESLANGEGEAALDYLSDFVEQACAPTRALH